MILTLKSIQLIFGIVLVVALIAIVAIEAWRLAQPPEQYAQRDYTPNAQTQTEAEQDEAKESFWQNPTSNPVAFFTAVLAIFSGILMVVSIFQLSILIGQGYTARQSADAAKQSAEVSKDALLVGQRSYVSMSFGQAINQDQVTKHVVGWIITPIWTNSGDTPTRNMRNHISAKVFDGQMPNNWHFPNIWEKRSR